MDSNLKKVLENLARAEVLIWAGERTTERGEGYISRVGRIVAFDSAIAAKVNGTKEYTTNLFVTDTGLLRSACTCPVRCNCKHGVALALAASAGLKAGEDFADVPPGEWRVKIEQVVAPAPPVKSNTAKPEYSERELAQIAKAKAACRLARKEVVHACETGEAGQIVKAVEALLHCMDYEEYYRYSEAFDNDFDLLYATIAPALAVLRHLGMNLADIIVWVYSLDRPYSGFVGCDAIDDVIMKPAVKCASKELWIEVAQMLERQMDQILSIERGGGTLFIQYQMDCVREAWCNAGCEERALPFWLRYAHRAEYWMDAAELLVKYAWFDEAIDVARLGVAASMVSSDWGNDYCELIQTPLADAFAGKGEHAKAAAILSEQFLSWGGCYEHHRTVELFDKIIREATAAGVGEAVRVALVHALETGVNPVPLQEWKAKDPEPDTPWRRTPQRVSYKRPAPPMLLRRGRFQGRMKDACFPN